MRTALRAMAWFIGGACICLLAGYVLLLVVNARDESPSPQAVALARAAARQPPVDDADNGFIYLLGLSAQGESAMAMGRMRAQALSAGEETPYIGAYPRPYRQQRPPEIAAFSRDCVEDDRACAQALASPGAMATARQWLAAEDWLLVRYRELIALPGWREIPGSGQPMSIPNYSAAMDGQWLLMLQAWLAARAGDGATVAQLLDQDTRFWRRVLRDTDTLIVKMVATAALKRDFGMGNLALRELGKNQAASIPAAWCLPLSDEEREMARALGGELRFSQTAFAWLVHERNEEPQDQERSLSSRLLDRLGRPLFQFQATINLIAARLEALAIASRADYPGLPAAIARADVAPRVAPWRWLFNPTGRLLARIPNGQYAGYVLRVADLEGVRRAALEASRLRAAGVAADDVAAHLAAADALRDPYTGAPLAWEDGAIGFNGHGPRRNLQLIVY